MAYKYGQTRNNPAGQLRNIQDEITAARERLDFYLERLAAIRKDDARLREASRRKHIKAATVIERRGRTSTPEEFRADAEAAYNKAMRLFPDSVQTGNDRRTALLKAVS